MLAAGLSLALNVMLARLLGAEKAGIYFLSLSIITIAAVIGQCGFGGSLVRFIASYIPTLEWEKINGVYASAMLIATIGSIVLSLTLFVCAPWLSCNLFSKPELSIPLRWMSISITPYTLSILHAYALQGLKKISYSITILSVIIPFTALAAGSLLIQKSGLRGAAWAFISATIVAFGLGRFFWWNSKKNIYPHRNKFSTRVLLKSSSPLFVVSIMQLIVSWSCVLFLGIWETSSNVALFQIANRISLLTTFVLVAVNSICAPNFSYYFKQNDIQGLVILVRKATWLMLLFSIPLLSIFCVFPSYILSIFGKEFVQGNVVLIILSLGQFINVSTGSVGQLLIMSGNEYYMQKASFITAILTIIISILLIKFYGILGASVSASISVIILNLSYLHYCRKKLKINPVSILFRINTLDG